MRRRTVIIGSLLIILFCFEIAISYSNYNSNLASPNASTSNNFFRRRILNELSSIPQVTGLDKQINQFIHKWHVKGASVAIVKEGKLVYAKGFGYANEDSLEMVQPEHLFRIASVSKLITAVAIMKLVEENKLTLEDKVFGQAGILNDSMYLDYRDRKVEDITVKHLLEHSGGWATRWYGDPMFATLEIANKLNVPAPATLEQVIHYVLKKHRLYFRPGTRSYYSNFGFAVLGEIIEKVTGIPYEDYVKYEVCAPLGIENMAIGHNLYQEKHKGEVTYYDKPGAPTRLSCYGDSEMVPRPYGGTDVEALSAAGGWVASSVDLMRLLVAIDSFDSKPDILSAKSLEVMTQPEKEYLSPLGWRATNKYGTWYRTGTLAGTSAVLVRTSEDISFVMLTNTSTWRGAYFSRDMKKMMEHAIHNVSQWPNHDLFEYQFPSNISPIPPQWWVKKDNNKDVLSLLKKQ